MANLAERLDDFAEAWRPKPGDKLIGSIVDLDQRVSKYNDELYPIVTVTAEAGSTEDGDKPIPAGEERAVHGFHTVARNEFAKQRPQFGERIGIAYHGKVDGKAYERYRIIVERDRAPKELDWEAMSESDETNEQDEPEKDDGIPF